MKNRKNHDIYTCIVCDVNHSICAGDLKVPLYNILMITLTFFFNFSERLIAPAYSMKLLN
jgi:hypothetical protein